MKRWIASIGLIAVAGVTGVTGACTSQDSEPPPRRIYDWNDFEVARMYPNIEVLYAGDHGIYRTCGPNNNVCHNSKEYPNLRTLSGLIDSIGRPCNQSREDQDEVHDWCERTGDMLALDDQLIGIARLVPTSTEQVPRQFRMHLRSAPVAADGADIEVMRVDDEGNSRVYGLAGSGIAVSQDPEDETSLILDLPAQPDDPEEYDSGLDLSRSFLRAGRPGDPAAIQVSDPNGNGTHGAELGHALIKPGEPHESYLIRRLTDPTFGVLMPLANCCYWRKEALRALWCWIAGLAPDGSNALESIDYATCPDGPDENLVYPVLGPECEASGMCPVTARQVTGPPDWNGVWSILQQSCSGSDCHVGGDAAGFSVSMMQETAYEEVLTRIVPGDAEASTLFQHLLPTCESPHCERMPYRRPPLTYTEIELVRTWIDQGALEIEP